MLAFDCSDSGAGDGSNDGDCVSESMIAPPPMSSSPVDEDEFLACPSASCEGFSAACFRSPAMAELRSIGHIDAFTYGGTCTSKLRHISMICCGGSSVRYCLLSSWSWATGIGWWW